MLRSIRPLLLLWLVVSAPALAQQDGQDIVPSPEPILRINADMHTGVIRRIGADRSCSVLATASEDKTIKLWSASTGELERTLRPPIGEGNNGKMFAVAVSPSGNWIAGGGWTRSGGDHWIHIFDRASGDLRARYGPTGQAISHLSISPDERFIAAALRGGRGVMVWENKDGGYDGWRLVLQDRNYAMRDVNGAEFDAAGALFTVALDGRLRRYAPGSREMRSVATRSGRQPYSVAVHPKRPMIAVGFADSLALDVYDSANLTWLYSTNTQEIRGGSLQAVAWSADGERLYGGGTHRDGSSFVVRSWSGNGRKQERPIGVASNTVMQLRACGRAVAVAAADPAFGLLTAEGTKPLWRGSAGADMRGKVGRNFAVSEDGSRVWFGLDRGSENAVLFDLHARRLVRSPRMPLELRTADREPVPVRNWQAQPAPTVDGRPIVLEQGERSQSLTAFDGGFVLGTDFLIRGYDREGGFLWRKQPSGTVWGVNVARGGELVVTAESDGSIRWYRVRAGAEPEEVLALFVQAQDLQWIAWRPTGHYMTSEAGERLIGWHINRGWTESPDFFPVSQYRNLLFKPDTVTLALGPIPRKPDDGNQFELAAGERSLERVSAEVPSGGSLFDTSTALDLVKNSQPPVVVIETDDPYYVRSEEITVHFVVRSPSGRPIQRVFAQLDGRLVKDEVRPDQLSRTKSNGWRGSIRIKVPPGAQRVDLFAEALGASTSQPAALKLLTPSVARKKLQSRLFAVMVGVGNYENSKLRIGDHPKNDAEDMENLFKAQEGPDRAFEKVHVRVLADSHATKKDILGALEWLKKEATEPDDIALFFFSGHGMTVNVTHYLIPFEYELGRTTTAISHADLMSELHQINASKVVVLDACHAGEAIQGALSRNARRFHTNHVSNELGDPQTRITFFASSQSTEQSFAMPDSRNSMFTLAILGALQGKGMLNAPIPKQTIETTDLYAYVKQRVKDLSGEKQTPISNISFLKDSLVLSIVD